VIFLKDKKIKKHFLYLVPKSTHSGIKKISVCYTLNKINGVFKKLIGVKNDEYESEGFLGQPTVFIFNTKYTYR